MVNPLIHSETEHTFTGSEFLDRCNKPQQRQKLICEAYTAEQLESYFKPSSWLAKMNFMNHLVLFNNVLMVVVAEKGAGKTTFMTLLRHHVDPDIQSIVMAATPSFSCDDFISQVMEAVHFNHSMDKPTSLDRLFELINGGQSHVLMLIDDAQYLSEDFLKELLTHIKQRANQNYFHVCLLSDFSLVGVLNQFHRAEFKDYIHTIEPGSLSEIETKTYILSRLPKDAEKWVTDDRMEQFYHMTSGHIARINAQLMDFFVPCEPKRSYIGRLSFAGVVLLAILINSTYWWYEQNKIDEGMATRAKLLQAFDADHPVVEGDTSRAKGQLTSQILPYTVASVHLTVQPAPLKTVLVDASEEDGFSEDSLVVMDKVVVIPKNIFIEHQTF